MYFFVTKMNDEMSRKWVMKCHKIKNRKSKCIYKRINKNCNYKFRCWDFLNILRFLIFFRLSKYWDFWTFCDLLYFWNIWMFLNILIFRSSLTTCHIFFTKYHVFKLYGKFLTRSKKCHEISCYQTIQYICF